MADATIADQIRERNRRQNDFRWMVSTQGTATISGLTFIPMLYAKNNFMDWQKRFQQGYNRLKEANESRVTNLADQYRSMIKGMSPDQIRDAISNYDSFDRFIKSARNTGVRERWKFERYFARDGSSGAEKVLGYYNDEGDFTKYTKGQFRLLRSDNPTVDGKPIYGHHINSVKSTLSADPTKINHTADVENIRIMSEKGHREIAHKGNYRNPTSGEANEVTSTHDRIVEKSKDILKNKEIAIAVVAGLISGTISAIIKYRELSNDPRPWKRKATIIAGSFAIEGVTTGFSIYIGNIVSKKVASYVAEKLAENFTFERARALGDVIGSSLGIAVVVIVRSGIKTVISILHGESAKIALAGFGRQVIVIVVEQTMFIIIGVCLNSITTIPEPHIAAIVTGLRIVYGIGKIGLTYRKNKKSIQENIDTRLNALHEIAAAYIVA